MTVDTILDETTAPRFETVAVSLSLPTGYR